MDFCSLLRLSRGIQYVSLRRVGDVVYLTQIASECKLAPLSNADDIKRWTALWAEYIKLIVGQKGPFSGYDVSDRVNELAERATFLIPRGIPSEDDEFCLVEGTSISDYALFLTDLFARTFPSPLIQRFYTVERTTWILDALRRFKVLFVVVPATLDIKFWPGDDFLADGEDGVNVKTNASTRSKRIANFVRSDKFRRQIVVASISSRPRWHFAQSLLAKENELTNLFGLPRAIDSLINDSRRIIYCADELANTLISGEKDKHIIRLAIFRSISASVLYVGDKYIPYTTPVWEIVLGINRPEMLAECIGKAPCCSASGLDIKLDAVFAYLTGEEYDLALEEAIAMIGALSVAFRSATDNNSSESLFAILRSLGLKYPHRSCRLSTLYRELTNHFYLNKQSLFVKELIEHCFGSVDELNRVAMGKKSVYNSWTSYLRAFKMAASSKSSALWKDVTSDQKPTWVSRSKRDGGRRNDFADSELAALDSYDKTGPLGSTDKMIPIDFESTMERLEDIRVYARIVTCAIISSGLIQTIFKFKNKCMFLLMFYRLT